ncbi:CPBP family intramembrane metalloprotease [Kordiimonas sp. SCSIO 12603]|uniref:CPBP family intramembrane glutamic endopeptidase n=1 Tax=Kordiimonas sp. SCSIO 12603 TaxID=2829596 RepID=UPI002104FCE0|nr:type II CAAX endopeptidase family protein [Kordiimonas sp. SCSIO 12603]UTW58969.1 CPBP family intramembrane metalloprotease [Kordiimonas sp. SCSIO 12603]
MSLIRHEELVSDDKVISTALTFVVLTGLFASIGYYMLIELGIKRHFMATFMWSPALAAFATCKIRGIDIRSLGWGFGPTRWAWTAYLIPIVYGLVAYGIIWVGGFGTVVDPQFINEVGAFLGLSGWSDTAVIIIAVLMFAVVGLVWRLGAVIGEEIGWRGFLTPLLLQKFSFPVTSLIVGVVWALWHLPILLYTKYNAGPQDIELQVLNYTVMTIGVSFILTYVYLRSRSIWAASLLHAAHNAFILSVLDPMTLKYEESWRFTGEFGFVLPYVILAFGLGFWYRARKEAQ